MDQNVFCLAGIFVLGYLLVNIVTMSTAEDEILRFNTLFFFFEKSSNFDVARKQSIIHKQFPAQVLEETMDIISSFSDREHYWKR